MVRKSIRKKITEEPKCNLLNRSMMILIQSRKSSKEASPCPRHRCPQDQELVHPKLINGKEIKRNSNKSPASIKLNRLRPTKSMTTNSQKTVKFDDTPSRWVTSKIWIVHKNSSGRVLLTLIEACSVNYLNYFKRISSRIRLTSRIWTRLFLAATKPSLLI